MLSINPSEVIWTILSFLALYFLLRHFLYDPLIRFMDDRRARIDAGLEEERSARAALDEEDRLLVERREESLQQARLRLAEEKSAGEQRRSEAQSHARAAAGQAAEQGREEARQLREKTERSLAERREELADYLAQRLLNEGNTEQ